MAPKINVKERFTDGEIDLSMSDLDEVPLKEIAQLKKAFSLDLSNNRLVVLPKAFPTLTHLTKLDLSKNELRELPEDFGNLVRLRHLDLYRNSLQHLPLSFSKLKDLKWLDLKDNPLVLTVAKVAGPCLDTKQCQSCAKDIVNFFSKLEQQVNSEIEMRNKTRQKQLEINQQKKQEEKKAKKKEKQKQKKEVQNTQKNSVESKVKNKKDNNNKKIKAEAVKEDQPSDSIFGRFLKVSLLFTVVLFILTACNVKYTEPVKIFVVNLFNSLLDKVPTDYKPYGVQVGRVFNDFHEKTGRATLRAVQYLNETFPPSKRQQFYDDFRNVLHSFLEKIRELYKSYVSR